MKFYELERLTALLEHIKHACPQGSKARTWRTNTVRWLRNCAEDFQGVAHFSLKRRISTAERLIHEFEGVTE